MNIEPLSEEALREGEAMPSDCCVALLPSTFHSLIAEVRRHREAAKAEVAAAQTRVAAWVRSTFGERSMADKWERIARFVEEAIELGQAEGLPEADAARILARVYNHPIGIGSQEVGGVMVTLLAWAASSNTDLMACALTEIERIEKPDTIARIREKQEQKAAAGTAHSFAPAPAPASAEGAQAQERESANNSFKEEANGADGLRLGDSATQERREGAARGLEREGDVSLPDSTRAPDGRGRAAAVAAVHRHEDGGQQAGAVAGISDGRVGRGLEHGVVAPGGASHAPAPSVPAATLAPRTYAEDALRAEMIELLTMFRGDLLDRPPSRDELEIGPTPSLIARCSAALRFLKGAPEAGHSRPSPSPQQHEGKDTK